MEMVDNHTDTLNSASQAPDEARYGASYLAWKGWHEAGFAKVGDLEASYFDAELTRTGKLDSKSRISVLEIGFGNGKFLAYASSKGWDVVGTEVNRSLVEMAARCGLKAIHADDLNTLQEGYFDLIVAFDVLEHIPQGQLLDFVKDLVQMLKAGGVFLARFPNADSPFGLVNQNGDITHMTAVGLGKVRYLARELKLQLVYFGGQAVPVCGSMTRSVRRFCGSLLFKAVDSVINKIFYPHDPISFCSPNVVMILQTPFPVPALTYES